MTAKKIQPTNPTVAPSEAKKGDDKTSTSARKTAAAGAKRGRKTLRHFI